jgi:hypothetical protein
MPPDLNSSGHFEIEQQVCQQPFGEAAAGVSVTALAGAGICAAVFLNASQLGETAR